jgi:uncharacterized protein (DUF433 family)
MSSSGFIRLSPQSVVLGPGSQPAVGRKIPKLEYGVRLICGIGGNLQFRPKQVERPGIFMTFILFLEKLMKQFPRITFNPEVMGGKACLRGMRVTASMVVGMVAVGHATEKILALYPYLEAEDIRQALAYAAWRLTEVEDSLDQLTAYEDSP